MLKKEYEEKVAELRSKIDTATAEEIPELRKQMEELEKVEITEEETKETAEEGTETKESEAENPVDERSLLRDTVKNLETRSITGIKEINKEERKVDEELQKELEKRGADLKSGKSIKVALLEEERSTVVASGTLLNKKYKNNISEAFEGVSGLVDMVNSINLNGGESYSVPFEKSYGEGDNTAEGDDYADSDDDTDYVETGRAKVTAYSEISKEAIKLPNANYQALVIKRVRDAIRKKIAKQLIIGAGTSTTIAGIYHADVKVMPTGEGTSDKFIPTIDSDTLNSIVFALGGDESTESEQMLILSKADLEAFSKVKIDDKFVYKITRNGKTGTIAYANGGLEVAYVINSACKSLSAESTSNGDYTIVYGSLMDYELPVFSELEIEESKDYNFKKGMIAYRGDTIVGGTVSKFNGFVRVKKGTGEISG